jgi:putative aldouronate transport system substrate-binding protein
VDAFNKFKSENTPAPINFDIMLMSTPAKDKLGALNIADDIVKVIIDKGDAVELWKQAVKSYDAKGVQDAIKEVNEEAAARGIQ